MKPQTLAGTRRFGSGWVALICCLAAVLVVASRAAGQEKASDQWEPEIRRFEEADRASAPKPGAVLFVGSSSIRMWESLAADFPSQYVLNRGFGGSQIADATRYVDRIVTPYRPKMIVFYAGDNDLAAGRSPDQVLADFDAFVVRVRKDLPDVPIAFISIKPSPARASLLEKMREANAKVESYAKTHERVTYVDVFTPMLGKDGQPRPELFGPDKLHMNRAGYELWTKVVGPYLSR
jgi:lysophospholipase L1-like esterase